MEQRRSFRGSARGRASCSSCFCRTVTGDRAPPARPGAVASRRYCLLAALDGPVTGTEQAGEPWRTVNPGKPLFGRREGAGYTMDAVTSRNMMRKSQIEGPAAPAPRNDKVTLKSGQDRRRVLRE